MKLRYLVGFLLILVATNRLRYYQLFNQGILGRNVYQEGSNKQEAYRRIRVIGF